MTHIVRLLHRVWVGPHKRPPQYDEWWHKWAQLNPNIQLVEWTDSDVSGMRISRLIPACSSWAIVADLVRIEVLFEHGGMYIDCDTEPLKPVSHLFDGDKLKLTEQGNEFPTAIFNGVIIAPPKHPLLGKVLDHFLSLKGPLTYMEVGPTGLFTALREHLSEIEWMPTRWFTPWNCLHRDKQVTFPDTLAIHHFAAAWGEKE